VVEGIGKGMLVRCEDPSIPNEHFLFRKDFFFFCFGIFSLLLNLVFFCSTLPPVPGPDFVLGLWLQLLILSLSLSLFTGLGR
jgi:hypothetical protein